MTEQRLPTPATSGEMYSHATVQELRRLNQNIEKLLDAITSPSDASSGEVILKEPATKNEAEIRAAPWDGYDDATVDDVMARLRDLDAAGRAHVLAYERANKKRAGVIQPLVNWNS